jgi:hypothetical protein
VAVDALLHLSELGAGWQGGETRPSSLRQPGCPGFDPNESHLVVTGHADARYTYAPGGVVVSLDVEVLPSPAAVRTDFARTVTRALPACLGYQLEHSSNVVHAKVVREHFPLPQGGGVSAAYRATVLVRSPTSAGLILSDYVYFGMGRTEYSFNVIAPMSAQAELGAFEFALARKLISRARLATA